MSGGPEWILRAHQRFYQAFIASFHQALHFKMRTIDRSISIRSPATCNSLAACRDTCCIFNQTPSAYRKQWLRFKPRQTSIIPAGENNSNVGALVRRSRLAAPVRRLSIFVTFRRRNPDARRRRGDLAPTATRLLDVISIICLRLWIIASNSRITFETFGGRWGQPRTYTDEGIESNANCHRIMRNRK